MNRIQDDRLSGMNYWDKLNYLNIYSQERRRERYQIIFLWKISQGSVSGYDVVFTSRGIRRGRQFIPNHIDPKAPALVRKARENSLGVRGARIFNLLPENMRTMNTEHVDMFKNHLDIFLASIPDEPTMPGLGRAADSNSLLHQLPLLYNQPR